MYKFRIASLITALAIAGCAVESPSLGTQRSAGEIYQQPAPMPAPAPAPGGLVECLTQPDATHGTLAHSPLAQVFEVFTAMSNWVAAQCGPDFHPTPRDVTCTFKTKVENVKAGDKAVAVGYDWGIPKDGIIKRSLGSKSEFVDVNGKVLHTVTYAGEPPLTEGVVGAFLCVMDCSGMLSSTLATAQNTAASAVGVPPGFIPPQNDIPMGRTFCTTFQQKLAAAGADCSLGKARDTWDVRISENKTPLKNTGKIEAEKTEEEANEAAKEKYPGAVKLVITRTYEIWTVDPAALQAKCDADYAAIPDRDALCTQKAPAAFFSSVISAQICTPNDVINNPIPMTDQAGTE